MNEIEMNNLILTLMTAMKVEMLITPSWQETPIREVSCSTKRETPKTKTSLQSIQSSELLTDSSPFHHL